MRTLPPGTARLANRDRQRHTGKVAALIHHFQQRNAVSISGGRNDILPVIPLGGFAAGKELF